MSVRIEKSIEVVDFRLVTSWLAQSYWSPGILQDRVERAARNSSLVLSAWVGDQMVGYARVVSDQTTFAWLADVWVDEGHRGLGIARLIVGTALADPDHQGLRRWVLATKDAHGVYEKVGFRPLPNPERWMVFMPGSIVAEYDGQSGRSLSDAQ